MWENIREQSGGHAIKIGGTHAERDQRPHIGAAVQDRFPAAVEERKRRPQHHRARQRQLRPRFRAAVDEAFEADAQHRRHGDDKKRQRKHRADPEPAGEIDKLRVRAPLAGRHAHRLQRHAADRAGAGFVADDLGMHGAGVLRALRHGLRFRLAGKVLGRLGFELALAAA